MIPDSVTSIGESAFEQCYRLTSIVISDSVTSIGKDAFDGCTALTDVTLEPFSNSIDRSVFPKNAKFHVSKAVWKQKIPVNTDRLAADSLIDNAEDYAYIVLYQRTNWWADWCVANIYWFAEAIPVITELLSAEGKLAPSKVKLFLRMVENASEIVDVRLLTDFLGAIRRFATGENLKTIEQYLGYMSVSDEKNPIEVRVAEKLKDYTISAEVQNVVKGGISYADGMGKCSENAVKCLLEEYARKWKENARSVSGGMGHVEMLEKGEEITSSKIADEIADALNRQELTAMLSNLAHGSKYRLFILAYARYADEEETEIFAAEITKKLKGHAKDRYWAKNGLQALYLSESKTAMKLFDKMGMLENYAKAHGTSAAEMREAAMMPDLGLDEKGTKVYNIGQARYEARITADLTVELIDVGTQKKVRSIPKKDADSQQVNAAQADFDALKKKVKDFIKERSETLRRMHVTGESIKQSTWRKAYLENPVLCRLAENVLWADANNKAFALVNGKMVTAESAIIEPNGDIHVAHVLELQEAEVQQWRQFLMQMNRPELFEQVWEPVLNGEIGTISTRYTNVFLTTAERNLLKKNLKQHGIPVRADVMEKEFDPYAGRYIFASENTMYFGKTLSVDYHINDHDKTITLKSANVRSQNKKELNAIIFELDRVAICHHIANDQSEYLKKELLDLFSAAQISEFLNHAISHHATNCTALLLDYKNKHYEQYNTMDSFVLTW